MRNVLFSFLPVLIDSKSIPCRLINILKYKVRHTKLRSHPSAKISKSVNCT